MASRGWRIVLAAALCFLKMATEVSAANILILHPLYAGSHDLVLRYVQDARGIDTRFWKSSLIPSSSH